MSTKSFSTLVPKGIQSINPYVPGKDAAQTAKETGITKIIKIASNENPLGPSPKAIEAAQNAILEVNRYPDPNGTLLKEKLSQHLGVAIESIALGNGSDLLLDLIARAFLHPGDEVIIPEYAFANFINIAKVNHATPVIAKAKDYGTDCETLLSSITDKTKLIFIANPNNPTGTWVDEDTLTTFLEKLPSNIIVVLDEAYFEYVNEPNYPNTIKLQEKFPMLAVTRTFSKAYGLAGLRVGYSVTHPDMTEILNRVRLPFVVSVPALSAAIAAIDDTEHLNKTLASNKKGYENLASFLESQQLDYIKGLGNFITCDMGDNAADIIKTLLAKGIILRGLTPYNMPNHVRISIGTEDEMQSFKTALLEYFNKH